MCSVGPSRGGAFTKLGEIGEFGERYALQGPLEGVVSPNDLEQLPCECSNNCLEHKKG